MGGEKHGSKSGHDGGFLQLFDWNAKSRKKLFSTKSDLPEQTKQGKRGEGHYPMTRFHMGAEDDYGARLSVKGGSDHSCASSVTDEDGYGTKVPGVVARLMGLDSLPTSNILDPYSTPFYDTLSLRDVPYRGKNLEFYHDPQIMHSRHLVDKIESPPRNVLDNRSQKLDMSCRPIGKFQTETLPPKSAKTIPITHHKLMSPIKSRIFVPSQDAARVMEAAAKIIGPGLQATPRTTRLSSSGSSSVSFKVRELREKLEATQRPSKGGEPSQRLVESNATKYLKGQPMNRNCNGSVYSTSLKPSASEYDGSMSGKSKGKSVSLAIQAKVNVQKREGLATTSNKIFGGSEEQDETKSVQSFKSQSNGPRISNKRTSNQTASSALRQNNQKQNCPNYRDKTVSKTSVSASPGKKETTKVSSQVRQKNLNRDVGTSRTVSRKSNLQERDSDKEASYWGTRNGPRKKRSLDGNMNFKKQVTDNMQLGKYEQTRHGSVVDRQFTWVEESRKKDMDVVSFTFTAPITRPLSGSDQPRQLAEKSTNICTDEKNKVLSSDITKLSSSGLNLIGGDALSVLLEQKLKELTSSLETSHNKYIKTNTIEESDQQNVCSAESGVGKTREKRAQQELLPRDTNIQMYSELSSSEPEQCRRKYIFQEVEVVDEYINNKPQTKQWNDYHIPSPVSTLEPFTLTESCYSSDSIASSAEESKQCSSSVQGQEVLFSSKKTGETRTDLSDSVSSTSSQARSTAWELGYVKHVLNNVELMFKDYATGRTRDIVNPHLFDQLEKRRGGGVRTGEDESRLERKMLFDCASQCLDLKCQRFVGSGFKLWAKGVAIVKRKERLSEEVYKEIQGWRSLGNSNVDELVDKDMSSKCGRWMDFEVDEFMLGVEIQGEILDSLVMEIVADMFHYNMSSSR